MKMRTSSSQAEGAERDFAVATKELVGEGWQVKTLRCARAGSDFKPIPGTEFDLKADLVLLAMGFVHPVHEGMLKSLGVKLDAPRQRRSQCEGLQDHRSRRSSPRVMRAAANHWWSGPSAKAGKPRALWTNS